jgi:hypothetical protein
MVITGYSNRLQAPPTQLPDSWQAPQAAHSMWKHRCPTCQATTLSRACVMRWRCCACQIAEHSREIVIRRIANAVLVIS